MRLHTLGHLQLNKYGASTPTQTVANTGGAYTRASTIPFFSDEGIVTEVGNDPTKGIITHGTTIDFFNNAGYSKFENNKQNISIGYNRKKWLDALAAFGVNAYALGARGDSDSFSTVNVWDQNGDGSGSGVQSLRAWNNQNFSLSSFSSTLNGTTQLRLHSFRNDLDDIGTTGLVRANVGDGLGTIIYGTANPTSTAVSDAVRLNSKILRYGVTGNAPVAKLEFQFANDTTVGSANTNVLTLSHDNIRFDLFNAATPNQTVANTGGAYTRASTIPFFSDEGIITEDASFGIATADNNLLFANALGTNSNSPTNTNGWHHISSPFNGSKSQFLGTHKSIYKIVLPISATTDGHAETIVDIKLGNLNNLDGGVAYHSYEELSVKINAVATTDFGVRTVFVTRKSLTASSLFSEHTGITKICRVGTDTATGNIVILIGEDGDAVSGDNGRKSVIIADIWSTGINPDYAISFEDTVSSSNVVIAKTVDYSTALFPNTTEYDSDADAVTAGLTINQYYLAGPGHIDGVRPGSPCRVNNI